MKHLLVDVEDKIVLCAEYPKVFARKNSEISVREKKTVTFIKEKVRCSLHESQYAVGKTEQKEKKRKIEKNSIENRKVDAFIENSIIIL